MAPLYNLPTVTKERAKTPGHQDQAWQNDKNKTGMAKSWSAEQKKTKKSWNKKSQA